MSEDTFLAGELAAAMVGGMIGTNRTVPVTLGDGTTVAPLLKHYAVVSPPDALQSAIYRHCHRSALVCSVGVRRMGP